MPHNATQFVRVQRLPRPPEHVANFFADAGHLERIAPSWLTLRYISDRHTPIVDEQTLDYRVHMFGLPLSWRTRIVTVRPDSLSYEQQIGPCHMWRHLYDYVPDGSGGTYLVDSIAYLLPWGWAGRLGRRAVAQHVIKRMFDVRAQRLQELLALG